MNISTTSYQPGAYGYQRYSSVSSPTSPPGLQKSPQINTPSPIPNEYNRTGTSSSTEKTSSDTPPFNNRKNEDIESPSDDRSTIRDEDATQSVQNSDLSEQDLKLLQELQNADTEVRAHEMAHIAAGGQYVTSGAKLEFRKGPDGQNYAVAGEVSIDTSPIPGDPQATAQKMRQIQQAALAPASPSNQDRKVASRASAISAKALSELMIQQVKERAGNNEQQAFGNTKQAADSYARVSGMPLEEQTRQHMNIAV